MKKRIESWSRERIFLKCRFVNRKNSRESLFHIQFLEALIELKVKFWVPKNSLRYYLYQAKSKNILRVNRS